MHYRSMIAFAGLACVIAFWAGRWSAPSQIDEPARTLPEIAISQRTPSDPTLDVPEPDLRVPEPRPIDSAPVASTPEIAAKPKAPKRKPGIQTQNVDFYVASVDFNPNGRVPTKEQLASLKNVIEDGEQELRMKVHEMDMLSGQFSMEKFEAGDISTKTGDWENKPQDGIYRCRVDDRDGKGGRIEILTGEYPSLDLACDNAKLTLAQLEAKYAAIIAGW